MKFMKVSAKSGENINQAYYSLIEEAYTYSYSKRKGKTVPVVIIDRSKVSNEQGKKCC